MIPNVGTLYNLALKNLYTRNISRGSITSTGSITTTGSITSTTITRINMPGNIQEGKWQEDTRKRFITSLKKNTLITTALLKRIWTP